MIDQTILHYKIIEKIGQGGMGEVYLAEDARLGRKVALKFLPASLTSDPEARERLLREAQAASRLSHPNILTIHAIEQADGRDFIAMEYIDGLTLDAAAKQAHWSIDELIDISVQIGDGLRSAHEAGIVHRDLKPANVLIDREGRARILDFGIAKVRGAAKLTKTGSTMGTIHYLSPEQAQGRDVDARSDLFSLGAIIYELVTGHQAFGGEHESAIVYAITHDEPEPLARYKKDVPDELQRIVSKCLAKDPAERYQGAAELLADLRTLKRVQTTGTMPTAPARKKPSGMLVGAIVLVLATAVGIVPRFFENKNPEGKHDAIMLAVLPFENMGSADDEYFANGVTDEILTNLAQIPGLGVISRTSTLRYKERTQSIKEIGEELGVAYVLEASIQWDKSGDASRIRLHPQLIRTSDDVHVWAQRYDAVMDDIFEVQSTIAAQVAGALSLALLPEQTDASGVNPTDNPRAYELYLQAKGYAAAQFGDMRIQHKAIELYREAIGLDSTFALARAGLSKSLSLVQFWDTYHSDLSGEAKSQALKALELSPGLPQGHIALGQYYNLSERKYEEALAEFARVQYTGVDEGEVLSQMGLVRMRMGEWHEALASFEEAYKHDPLSVPLSLSLIQIHTLMRRFDDALRYADHLISLDPGDPGSYGWKIDVYLHGKGQPEEARRVLDEAAAFVDPIDILVGGGFSLVEYGLTDATPDELLKHWVSRGSLPHDTTEYHEVLAQLNAWRGDPVSARSHLDTLRTHVEADLVRLEAARDSGQLDPTHTAHLHSGLGMIYARLGKKEPAIYHAETGLRMLPVEACHW